MACSKCGKKKNIVVVDESPLPQYHTESSGGPKAQISARADLVIQTPAVKGMMKTGHTATMSLYEAQGLINAGAPIGIIKVWTR